MYQDLVNNVNVTFTVTSGSLVGNASINTNDAGGSLSITPSTAGSLQTTASSSNFYLYFNGVYSISDNYVYNAGTVFSENTFIINWTYTAPTVTTTPSPPPSASLSPSSSNSSGKSGPSQPNISPAPTITSASTTTPVVMTPVVTPSIGSFNLTTMVLLIIIILILVIASFLVLIKKKSVFKLKFWQLHSLLDFNHSS